MPRSGTSISPDETQAGPSVSNKTSNNQPSTTRVTRADLQKVLDWHPLPLKGRKGSVSTRPPQYFDMHMCDQLTLKHIVHLPSLTTDLLAIVDMYLEDEHHKPILLPLDTGFVDSDMMRTIDSKNAQDAMQEHEVQARQSLVAKYLVPIASTLAFRLSDWHSHFFRWGLSAKGVKKAIADGYFNIIPDDSPPIDPYIHRGLSLIHQYFPNTAVWELKSLFAGSRSHLEHIMAHSKIPDLFPWVRCPGVRCPAHHNRDGTEAVTGARMGFDAAEPVCQLNSKLHPPTHAQAGIHRDTIHSKHILQQVWAEAVLQDSTFVIVQCGNYEMICYRFRQQNKLYISDIIEVSEKGYGKLQIGLFLAIYRDALDRAWQISNAESANSFPTSWIRDFSQPKKGAKKRLSKLEKLDLQRAAKHGARHEEVVQITSSQKNLVPLHLPRRFIRIDHSGISPATAQLSIKIVKALHCQVFKAVIQYGETVLDQKFVVKYAHNHQDYVKLEAEFRNYCELSQRKITGIPDIIGCFTYFDPDMEFLRHIILVMRDVGESLVDTGASITISTRVSYAHLLQELHQAGYYHRDLTDRKLCIGGAYGTRASLIGFGKLVKLESSDSDGRMDEFESLARILNEIQDGYVERMRKRVKHTTASGSSHSPTSVLLLGPLTGDLVPISSDIVEQTLARLRPKVMGDFLYFEIFEGDDEAFSFMESILSSSSYKLVPRQIIPARLNVR